MSIPDLETWFASCEETTVKIWVENPEILMEKKFGLKQKSYTTFRVLMKSSSGDLVGVRHRYSEFEALRENLRDRYLPLGVFVPQLPAKKLLNNTDSEFIKERMQGLTLFCEGIVANPFLRHDRAFKDFMDMGNQDGDRNIGELMLGSTFARLPNPTNPLVRLMVLKEEIVAMEKHAKATLDASRATQAAFLSMQQANTSMQSALAGWGNFEQESVRCLNGKYNGQADPVMRDADGAPKMLNRMSLYYAQTHQGTTDLPDQASVLYCPSFEYEYNRCMAFNELFKYHDDLANFIDKQRAKVEKMDRSKLDKLMEAQAVLEEKKICLSAFYKGLLFFSIPINVRDRSINLRRAGGFVGSTMLVSACAVEDASMSFLRDMEINPAATVASTSVVLEQLSLKTLNATNATITSSTWNELPPLVAPCYGLLRQAMGQTLTSPLYSSSASAKDPNDLAALMKQAEIAIVAAREDPFEEEPATPPPVPTFAAPEPEEPVAPSFQPDQAKVNSLLGDLTGDGPSSGKKDDLWY